MKLFKKIVMMLLAVSMLASFAVISASAEGLSGTIAYGAANVEVETALNIRSGPGTDYDVVGSIPAGSTVVFVNWHNRDWCEVNFEGIKGYASIRYLSEIRDRANFEAIGTVIADGVRMRTEPNTSADILDYYYSGTELQVIGINCGWYKVEDGSLTGYIRSDLMEISGGEFGSSSETSLGRRIADYTLRFVGYPYVYGAESPSDGFDCSGLMYYVYDQFGYDLERRASLQYANDGVRVSKSELQPGDLVFFSGNGESVTHVGMYIGDGRFVHASNSRVGVITSNLYSNHYTEEYWGAKRII